MITKSNFGGAQRYLFDLATNLPADKFDVVVAFGGTGERDAETGRLKKLLDEQDVRTIVIQNFMRDISLFKEFKAFFEIIQIVRKEKPDILHTMSSKAGGLGALAGRVCGVKQVVFTSHGLAYDESWRPFWQRALILFSSWWTFVFATKTIQITNDTYERARKLPFMKNKIVLIHNGIQSPDFVDRDKARAHLCKHENVCNEDWIGTIAELTPNKNLMALIHAFEILREKGSSAHLWIVGGGEEEESIKKYIREKSIENFVHVTGYVTDASKYLNAFTIFTLPSVKEGLPYVLIEAGFASLPVVASDIPGITDLIQNNKTGFLTKTDSRSLADALEILSGDEELRRKYGKALHDHICSHFSIHQMVENTITLY